MIAHESSLARVAQGSSSARAVIAGGVAVLDFGVAASLAIIALVNLGSNDFTREGLALFDKGSIPARANGPPLSAVPPVRVA
jgi:hypothetical protein